MKLIPGAISDVLIIEPHAHFDARGFFFESFHQAQFNQAVGKSVHFVQENQSHSVRHVLRGLHYQIRQPQGKLMRVLAGEVFDVAVDLRKSSATFAHWAGFTLSAENRRQLWIPPGFAHGFCVTSTTADILYKATDYWVPAYERCIAWNDPTINIRWPICGEPILSDKDKRGVWLNAAEVFA